MFRAQAFKRYDDYTHSSEDIVRELHNFAAKAIGKTRTSLPYKKMLYTGASFAVSVDESLRSFQDKWQKENGEHLKATKRHTICCKMDEETKNCDEDGKNGNVRLDEIGEEMQHNNNDGNTSDNNNDHGEEKEHGKLQNSISERSKSLSRF